MNGLPIIFIHRDACYYLPHSVAQARAISSDSPVIVLGNDGNRGLKGVRHVHYDQHAGSARKFQTIYQHRSDHRIHDELFCFQRWFVLRDFLRAENMDACLYLDSDVLLFVDAGKELAALRERETFDLTAVQGTSLSPHSVFVPCLESLERLCEFQMLCYSDAEWFDRLEIHLNTLGEKENGGGVSDMTIFSLFNQSGKGCVLDLHQIRDETVFDLYLGRPSGYEMKDRLMRVSWIQGFPCGLHLESGKWIRFKTLHFQGSQAKAQMGEFVRLSSDEEKRDHRDNLKHSARMVTLGNWRRRLRRWSGKPAWNPGI